jgi:hypothetical protein
VRPWSLFWLNTHAERQMRRRGFSETEVLQALASGEVIEDYPDDYPDPSQLILAFVGDRAVHVAVSYRVSRDAIIVLTVYEPTEDRWDDGFRRRRTR